MKASLLESTSFLSHSTITDEAAGSAYVENFAMDVFGQADDEDRAGRATKATVRKFIVAAQFIEVLRCFDPPNGMRDELEQKLLYARWKAADIARALKEGKTPTPGPPKDERSPSDQKPFPSLPDALSTTSHSAHAPRAPHISAESTLRDLHAPPPPPPLNGRQDSSDSGTRDAVVTPGIEPESEIAREPGSSSPESGGEAFTLPSTPRTIDHASNPAPPPTTTTTTTSPPHPTRRPSLGGLRQDRPDGYHGEKKEVRFAGPDGAPLSPSAAAAAGTLDSDTTLDPATGSGSEGTGPEGPAGDHEQGAEMTVKPPVADEVEWKGKEEGEGEDATRRFPTIPVVPPAAPLPSAKAYNIPSAPAITPSSNPAPPLPSAPSAPAPTPTAAYPTELDSKSIERCQKHARWAISALDYEDLETARKELRLALDLLEGR
ncbi:hypothetical protein QFC24_002437 [Naganishia onofrii]|uniref:Uncharacterized protein n=1 Tax=Naganishia onofrii TaxID=1851511 RepID=A0ACC2XS20_9TREE|nr:hypothetical protein QFC24_002437 [Naganishia onofrii]